MTPRQNSRRSPPSLSAVPRGRSRGCELWLSERLDEVARRSALKGSPQLASFELSEEEERALERLLG